MRATLHLVGEADQAWEELRAATGAESDDPPFLIGKPANPEIGGIPIFMSREPDEKHAMLTILVLPADEMPENEESSGPEEGTKDADLDEFFALVRGKVEFASVTFDCTASLVLKKGSEFESRLPLPISLWGAGDSMFSQMVGARFAVTRRSLKDAWVAADLFSEDVRLQAHFGRRMPVGVDAINQAWASGVAMLGHMVGRAK